MYPPIEPYDCGHLEVGDGHAVYWEVAGSRDGLPAVWLHGGPGAPASPDSRRNFNPARYRRSSSTSEAAAAADPWPATPALTCLRTPLLTWSLTAPRMNTPTGAGRPR